MIKRIVKEDKKRILGIRQLQTQKKAAGGAAFFSFFGKKNLFHGEFLGGVPLGGEEGNDVGAGGEGADVDGDCLIA